jgi:NADPH:quinone reductase-like Zn-dependent oxidoreductase
MPLNLGSDAAASTPTVFITVDCAFRQLAAVRPGDRALVHAAAGGVGIAAIQMVAALGGETVATAGSSSKRALVRSLGPSQVLGSRDTLFASELAEVGGASVVLNSLTSSGMVAGSLAALSAGGRFVEISKRDIWSPARVAQGNSCAAARQRVRLKPQATQPSPHASTFLALQSALTCCTRCLPWTSCPRPLCTPAWLA